jgi:hypothetical protein
MWDKKRQASIASANHVLRIFLRAVLGGIQEKIDFLNPQPNCRFGASMLQ